MIRGYQVFNMLFDTQNNYGMFQNSLVSIVIRTKNEEEWLGRVLAKFQKQTYFPLEIIIVDSGSTDKTLEIIDQYPNIKLIEIKPEEFSYSYALNMGIKNAKGKYIGIFSGHSLPLNKKMIENAVEMLGKNSNLAAVTGYYFPLPDDSIVNIVRSYIGYLHKPENERNCKSMTNTNSLIRRDLWSDYSFDESLLDGCEDYDWACEMISRGYDVVKSKKFTVRHSHAHVPNALNWDERVVIWEKAISKIDKKKRPST
jgi:rhamnosyltransferase